MSAVLWVTPALGERPVGGRELLSSLHREALERVCGERLSVVELSRAPVTGVRGVVGAFQGHLDGVSTAALERIDRLVAARGITHVLLDGSNLGELARHVRRTSSTVRISTFFHNVEARFFFGALRAQRTVRALGVLAANSLAERKAVRFSDQRITLSQHDSAWLSRLYGRGATHVMPLALADRRRPASATPWVERAPYALFVGGNFYANRDGIAWFVREVVPRIDVPTCIVGRGLEGLRGQLERPGKVEVIGAVDDLEPWYRHAAFVVAPIFDGSGMKTKVAEALMFGKHVLGTPDAFVGYEGAARAAGRVCSTADDFVEAIRGASRAAFPEFSPSLRALYDAEYSLQAATRRMENLLT